ncbi:MAG: hypothetical protein ACRDVW_05895 [Acidimicrobiales bacterium]
MTVDLAAATASDITPDLRQAPANQLGSGVTVVIGCAALAVFYVATAPGPG